ncbi:MAG: diadenylate cyclase CdaA [Paludibacteraceae bacterium]|jgi:uncharacterized protein (TIGR00159 family)|nr:diadenylate cyclase CdaA [Paludibacteraceae bacterium]
MGIEFGIKDIIDIVLVAFLMYQTYILLKGTNAVNIFIGILLFVIGWFLVSFVFRMQLLGAIMDKVMSVGAIVLIVIFKDEIRRFFSVLGSSRRFRILNWMQKKLFRTGSGFRNEDELTENNIHQIVWACRDMARHKCGALIVIEMRAILKSYIRTGERINANISSRLIENIFFKNSPLHDGAMIISRNRIAAASCILPMSQNLSIPKELGMRHRAGLGLTEKTDALVIVVSEETGAISIMKNGNVYHDIQPDVLLKELSGKLDSLDVVSPASSFAKEQG